MIIQNYYFLVSFSTFLQVSTECKLNQLLTIFDEDNLVSHLQEDCAAELATELVHNFYEGDITIDVTPGYGFSSIRLKASIYDPKSQDQLPISVISMKGGTASTAFQARQPVPIALTNTTMRNLVKQCDSKIQQMFNLKEDISGLFRPNMNPVSQEILKAIHHHYIVNYRGNQVCHSILL